jgi:SAM-dependent methyltransferase
MIKNKYAMVGVYSSFDPEFSCDPTLLKEQEVNWMPGYFQLVDSSLIGHIRADEDLPDGNTGIDTSYSVMIKQEGYKIGIAPTYVLHDYKPTSWIKQEVVEPTNKHMMDRYGHQYFDWCNGLGNIVGGAPINKMDAGRTKLIQWQKENYVAEEGKLKLHLGCGDQKYPGFINCDIDGDVDKIYDITQKSDWEPNSVDHISCHHVLEHVPYRLFNKVLSEWYRILKIGGTVDLGMPDVELVAREFLEGSEDRRWNATIYIMYGQQGTTTKPPRELTELDPLIEGQFHRGGLTKDRACLLFQNLGFEILDSYHYDGNGNPSLFVYAKKVS